MSHDREVRPVRSDHDREAFARVRAAHTLYDGLPPEPLPAEAEALLLWRGDQPLACASIAVADTLHGVEGASGVLGHFEAVDLPSAVGLLSEACARLARRGVRRVLGPMNGSTWGRYRLALPDEPGEPGAVPFLGEPVNPPDYPAWFEAAGFTVAARYESRIDEAPHEPAAQALELAERVARAGIRIRALDPTRFLEESRLLHELSLASFADNLYYTPIEWPTFRAQYEKLQPLIQPELVLIAERATGEPLAFQFAYLDPIARRLGFATRAVVKTVATRPSARGLGLAGHMLDLLRGRAVALGATSIVHALMHVNNFSMKMSSRHRSRVLRRYALYEWLP